MWPDVKNNFLSLLFKKSQLNKSHIINNLLTSSARSLQGNLRPRSCYMSLAMLGLYFKPSVWDFPVKTSLSVNKCYIVSNVQKKALKVKQFCDPKRILNHIFKCQTNTVISWNWLIVTMIKKQFIAMASKLLLIL